MWRVFASGAVVSLDVDANAACRELARLRIERANVKLDVINIGGQRSLEDQLN